MHLIYEIGAIANRLMLVVNCDAKNRSSIPQLIFRGPIARNIPKLDPEYLKLTYILDIYYQRGISQILILTDQGTFPKNTLNVKGIKTNQE